MQLPPALWIAGQARGEASGGTIELIEPATEQPLVPVPAAGRAEVDEALAVAAQFQQADWACAIPGCARRIASVPNSYASD